MSADQTPPGIFTASTPPESSGASQFCTTSRGPKYPTDALDSSARNTFTGIVRVRPEPWGVIRYDFQSDEFRAEVEDGKIPIPSAPLGVGWLPTGKCNKKCGHCYGNLEELPPDNLSTEDCLTIVRRLVESKVMRVTISGGEPMLRRDLFTIVSALQQAGVAVILGTNGSLIDTSAIDHLRMCNRIEISLDAHTEALNNKLRPSRNGQGNSWVETLCAISLCVSNKLPVRAMTTVNSLNEEHLFELAELLAQLGVQDWSLSWTIAAGRARANYTELKPRAQRISEHLDRVRALYPSIRLKQSNRSGYNRYYCLILPNGDIGTEDVQLGKKLQFGSILRHSVLAFWDEAHFNLQQHFEKWIGDRVFSLHSPIPVDYRRSA
jgi:MoaA/NifB/PqqE/SkfB family radical SAM enzyme